MIYTANKNITSTCIYGTWHFKLGESVPLLIAKKFPQHVIESEEPKQEVIENTKLEEIIEEDDTETKSYKKGKN